MTLETSTVLAGSVNPLRAEIISVGDELISGQRLNTNSQWLSQQFANWGIPVAFHTTIGDDLEINISAIRQAAGRADLVCLTGGLGPTEDDLTRQALARAAEVDLELDPTSLQYIEQLFRRRQREMAPANRIQAMFPRGSRILPNRNGTAPGIDLTISVDNHRQARFFALPGVPAEMREMWVESVVPALQLHLGNSPQKIVHRAIHCFGAGESDIERQLPHLIARGRVPQVGITASQATITLRISALGPTEDACRESIEPTARVIYDCLGSLIFGENDEQLEGVVLRHLESQNERLAVIETATCGLVSHWFSRIGSRAFAGGKTVAPHDRSNTAAHPDQAVQWALTACREFDASWGLGIGPLIPGQDASSPAQLPLALAHEDEIAVRQFSYVGHPELLQTRAAKQAINWLRLRLLGID